MNSGLFDRLRHLEVIQIDEALEAIPKLLDLWQASKDHYESMLPDAQATYGEKVGEALNALKDLDRVISHGK